MSDKKSKEKKLLILIARTKHTAIEKEQLDRIIKLNEIDWPYVYYNAIINKIQNFLYLYIKNNDYKIYKMNEQIYFNLHNFFYSWMIHYNEHIASCIPIFNEFENARINYAVIKGISLIEQVYKKNLKYLRFFKDTDLLVGFESLQCVSKILKKHGYTQGIYVPKTHSIKSSTRQEKIQRKMTTHELLPFIKIKKLSLQNTVDYISEFDINFTIFEGGIYKDPVDNNDILKEKKHIEVNGLKFKTLEPTWFLVQLCYHLYKDIRYVKNKKYIKKIDIINLCDIREYIKMYRKKINWHELYNICQLDRVKQGVFTALSLTQRLYGDLSIDGFLKNIEPKNIQFKDFFADFTCNFETNLFS